MKPKEKQPSPPESHGQARAGQAWRALAGCGINTTTADAVVQKWLKQPALNFLLLYQL